jgi:hypothetical protein
MHTQLTKNIFKFFVITSIVGFGLLTSAHANPDKPSAVVESASYYFGTALEGSPIIHDYIIKNNGGVNLEIQNVKSGWGCTTASYDKLILPGAEGKITINFNSRGFSGKIDKTIEVKTNDPEHSQIHLKMTGKIRKLVNIQPEKVHLKGIIGEEISQTVTITLAEEAFNIVKVSLSKGTDIRYSMEQIELSGKKAYRLTVENIKKTEGRYLDYITIKTDRSDFPSLNIPVSGDIKQPQVESKKVEDNQPASTDSFEGRWESPMYLNMVRGSKWKANQKN